MINVNIDADLLFLHWEATASGGEGIYPGDIKN